MNKRLRNISQYIFCGDDHGNDNNIEFEDVISTDEFLYEDLMGRFFQPPTGNYTYTLEKYVSCFTYKLTEISIKNRRYFACIFKLRLRLIQNLWYGNCRSLIQISLKYVLKIPIDQKPNRRQTIIWTNDSLAVYWCCMTRPRWINTDVELHIFYKLNPPNSSQGNEMKYKSGYDYHRLNTLRCCNAYRDRTV